MRVARTIMVALWLLLAVATGSAAQDPGWPREHTQDGNTLVIYQPQVDDWKNFLELDWRMAVSLTAKGGKTAVGVVVMKGDTQVDHDQKMVLITHLQILKTHFPSLDPASSAQMDQLLRAFLPPAVSISLHQLIASVPKKATTPGVQLKNDPPIIFVSYTPAILLDVDGQPMRVPIQKTNLEYVINTSWRLFLDKTKSTYYLLAGAQWLQASKLEGPWSAAQELPKDMSSLAIEPQWADLKKVIPLQPAKPEAIVPKVFYSANPAQVILFNGKPEYSQIAGTQLVYATNTTSYLFFYAPNRQYYYLTAGRWFSAGDLNGPWTFATPNLPADFARIPPSSPAGQVLASVPGTDEAKDAVLLAQVPNTVIVDPHAAAAQARVEYDGSPEFVPIEGTSMFYAKNTAQRVIRVGDLYYLCLQGIWFFSTDPQGPWQTAPSIPQVIYTIPPSSPVYNVTYVTQTTISDGNVQASYTAGYMGTFVMGVTMGAVIAGGTGYYYPPYYAYPVYGHPIYCPYPATYGSMSYYHTTTGAYGVSQTAYGPYGAATRTASYNPYTGTYARTASASTAYGSSAFGQAYNPYTGASAATRQGSNAYGSWGSSAVSKGGQTAYTQHASTAQGTVGSVQTSSGGRAAGVSTAHGTTAAGKTSSGDMYAGHDGNVYKNTGSGWEKYDNGSWNSVQKPTSSQEASAQQRAQGAEQQHPSSSQPSEGGEHMQGLQQEMQNRERGAQSSERFQQFERSRGGGERSGGGGGFQRGGGRGRR